MRRTGIVAAAIVVCAALVAQALAASPQLGGAMKHMLVAQVDQSLVVVLEGDPNERIQLYDYGETYDPPADVLNDMAYSGRYGWLANGRFNLPSGAQIWVELVEQSDDLWVYEELTFDPLWGTDGSSLRWQWDGTMVHNWYASDVCGEFYATYSVYVADSAGEPLAGWTPGLVTLHWASTLTPAGDLDGDSAVTSTDLSILLTNFGASGVSHEDGDVNEDGVVDSTDLSLLLAEFGAAC